LIGCMQLLAAALLMFGCQVLLGGLRLPPATPDHWRDVSPQRMFNAFKDIVIFYPVFCWGIMISLVLVRARSVAFEARRQGLVASPGFRDRRDWANKLHKAPAPPALVFATITFCTFILMTVALAEDVQWALKHQNWRLVAHIVYQLGTGLLLGLFVSWALARPESASGA
jgi:hypothetical protein